MQDITFKNDAKVLHLFMPTHNPRVNVTFNKDDFEELQFWAKHRGSSIAAVVREFTQRAMHDEDSEQLVRLADTRLNDPTAEYYTHEEAWAHLES